MIRGVIFDLGDTLMFCDASSAELEPERTAALLTDLGTRGAVVGETFGSDFAAAQRAAYEHSIETNLEYPLVQILSDTLGRHAVCYLPDAVIPRLLKSYLSPEDSHWHPYPDAYPTLAELKARGLKLALLSNARDDAFVRRLVSLGNLTEFFDPLLTSTALGIRKPDARAFKPILEVWNLPAHDIAMVGDLPQFDVLGARNVGMTAILLAEQRFDPFESRTQDGADRLMEPDHIIHQLAELPDLLAAHSA